jgi:hypothetical protein
MNNIVELKEYKDNKKNLELIEKEKWMRIIEEGIKELGISRDIRED